jgi:cysteinyl-tRNA synthetase
MDLRLYDTLTREKRVFTPIDPFNVRIYVCGPTVYDFAHIGNARPVIVFDVLFRLLRHLYGADHVTYVRNITDVDDKINDRAARDFPGLPLNEAIRGVTEQTATQFHADVSALGSLPPTFEPRATDFVLPRADGKTDMVTLIKQLIARGHAYEAGGEVLFDTQSMPDYGMLSHRKLDEQLAGARVAVDAHKRHPADFVLWKLSSENEPGWESPWGRGRPGWHIECSAMSAAYLGEVFDIHGGGLDLIFPHHENEIAQSRCAHGTPVMANYWMHNGFLQVEGEKMSKSLGNFFTISELLNDWPGEVLRFQMLMSHYRQPIDWMATKSAEIEDELEAWTAILIQTDAERDGYSRATRKEAPRPSPELIEALLDDLNTAQAIAVLRANYKLARNGGFETKQQFLMDCQFLGLLRHDKLWIHLRATFTRNARNLSVPVDVVRKLRVAIANNDATLRSSAEKRLAASGLAVEATADGHLVLVPQTAEAKAREAIVVDLISNRTAARARKDFKESDRIRDELLTMGVVLKDGKDADGKPVTTWEIAR